MSSVFHYCPRDNFALTKKNIDGADLFQCVQCHGLWIPKESLLALTVNRNISLLTEHIEEERLPDHFQQGILPCPSDNTRMRFTPVQTIEVDICPSCHGVWLDKGELESLPKEESPQPQNSYAVVNALDALSYLPYVVDANMVQASVETAGNAIGVVAEAAASNLDSIGDLLGSLLGAIAEALFSG